VSETGKSSITDSLRLFADIARFRKGPEDLPASVALLGLAIGGAIVLRVLLLGVLPLPAGGNPVLVIGIGIGVTLLFLWVVLQLARHPERYVQTASAMFGFQVVMAPLLIGSGWLFLTLGETSAWQLPVMLLRMAVEVWALAVAARILRSATSWPLFACVSLAIANELLTFLAIAGLFPQAGATPAAA
jgi:hypothetical protein